MLSAIAPTRRNRHETYRARKRDIFQQVCHDSTVVLLDLIGVAICLLNWLQSISRWCQALRSLLEVSADLVCTIDDLEQCACQLRIYSQSTLTNRRSCSSGKKSGSSISHFCSWHATSQASMSMSSFSSSLGHGAVVHRRSLKCLNATLITRKCLGFRIFSERALRSGRFLPEGVSESLSELLSSSESELTDATLSCLLGVF